MTAVNYRYNVGDVLLRKIRGDLLNPWDQATVISQEVGRYRDKLSPKYILSIFDGRPKRQVKYSETYVRTFRPEAEMLNVLRRDAVEALLPLNIGIDNVSMWYISAFKIAAEIAYMLQEIPPTGLISCTPTDLMRTPTFERMYHNRNKAVTLARWKVLEWHYLIQFLKGVHNDVIRDMTLEAIDKFLI